MKRSTFSRVNCNDGHCPRHVRVVSMWDILS
ncbi:hypothetical protein VPH1254_0063 [Vibrio phage 1254]